METYQRRRFRKCKETNSEMELQNCKNGVQVPPPLIPTSDHNPVFQLNSVNADRDVSSGVYLFNNSQVEVGSVYEIDHVHLPPRTPIQLKSIRVAMVSEKTELNVAVRYPSMDSLQTYFSNSIREMYPALDEKFVMGKALAAKVLLRPVPSQRFAENKHLRGFWLVNAATNDVSETDDSEKKGNCLTELKDNAMVRWGIRRQVKFLERHKENVNDNVQSSLSFYTKGSKKTKVEAIENSEEMAGDIDDEDDDQEDDEGDDDDDDDDDEDDDEDEGEDQKERIAYSNEETMIEEGQEMDRNLKRKRYKLRNSTRQNTKNVKLAKKKRQKKKTAKKSHSRRGQNRCRDLFVIENPKDRWSAERYRLATENLLAVMKAKRATAGNPILRPDLREEARKRIGDTGLLDHLLKHMAGKLAPGGEERFRRRHNADGAMEYWLESADLVNIRKEAGVNDPFWIPPPGWKPGDCPSQDPILARELTLLKEEMSQLKRNAKDMVPRKLLEQELGNLRREMDKIVSNKQQEENLAIEVHSNPSDISQKLDQVANTLVTSKSDIAKASPLSLEKYNEQLLIIQDVVKGIEEEIKNSLMRDQEGKSREAGTREEAEVKQVINMRGEKEAAAAKAEKTAAEEKAEKIERLKSGFRICKPQGTFLWPNMARNNTVTTTSTGSMAAATSPQVVVQVEDLLMVPTPPSVSSSTALVPPQLPYNTNNQLRPASPVRPLAERRAVTVTVSTLSNEKGDNSYSTTTTMTTTTSTNKYSPNINLNDVPSTHPVVVGISGNRLPSVMSQMIPDEVQKTNSRSWEVMTSGDVGLASTSVENVEKKLMKRQSSSASSLSTGKDLGTWLALATANSASDDSS